MTDVKTTFETRALQGDLCWPGGRRIAVVFNVAWEMWRDGATSGVGPMGNVLPDGMLDPNADSYGRYNVAAGSRRLLDILERHGIRASILTSGLVAERQPDALRRAAQSGHDIVGHGLAQDMLGPALSAEEDAASIARSTAAIEAATGARPSGWVSPRVTSGPDSQQRLVEAGYRWHGDALDADRPYVQVFPEGEILAVPMSVEFNDLPHAMRFGRTPGQFVQMVTEAIEGIRTQPAETIILDIFAHGHCYGRPAAAWAINEIAARCVSDEALWLTTRTQIAEHCFSEMDGRQCI
ncbi:polysaccharide deacetylase family protein [Jannaschia formosa]|uniref:polysaccharide deacetylase family protein n=1 Tax=Jannaschia formosa TaxID=2259592 RepID=UPI000E1C1043|nr:polysaccharide deacetylase family protein [Jannaschia formosa]TFL19454.1 polysaccharide deacetylase [Jannaschia formosa]